MVFTCLSMPVLCDVVTVKDLFSAERLQHAALGFL